MTDDSFAAWAIVELLGHRRLGAHVSEATIAGASFLRLDVPGADGEPPMTQFVSPGSLYALTPTTEELARKVAALSRPAPVSRFELARADAEDDEDPF